MEILNRGVNMEEIMNRSESSVEITRNAKGIIQFSVKIYNDNIEEAMSKVIKTTDELIKKYPFQ